MEAHRLSAAKPTLSPVAKSLRDLEEWAARILRDYDAQGNHRTGSAVDAASARWLARSIERCGVSARFDRFDLDRIEMVDCSVEIEGRKINGVPLFDGGFTGADGVSGALGINGDDCDIAIEEVFQSGADGKSTRRNTNASGRHAAVLRLTHGAQPGLVLANAPRFLDPSGVPTLQVSGVQAEWLKERASGGSRATLRAHVRRIRGRALNVVATIQGSQAALPPMVVSTPRSGWWNCASERGGGLVCWLEALRRLSAEPPSRTCIFVSFSGHELGLMGGRHFARSRADGIAGTPAWLHFGANLGAPRMPVRLQSSDQALIDRAAPILKAAGVELASANNVGTPRGEAAVPHELGIPYLAPISSSLVFHHSADRWPEAVDPASLARLADGFANVARVMAAR